MLTDTLSEPHLAMLRASAISDDLISERGYFSVTTFSEARALGFSEAQSLVPALVLPLWDVHGEAAGHVLRPDDPRTLRNGKIAKYEQRRGARAVLDVPPRCRNRLGDPSIPLYITEGAKKADALAACGATAINLGGVWNWRGKNELGGKTALPDWEAVALNERQVRIVFDSDVSTKSAVASALLRLKRLLEQRGAVVEVIYLPDDLASGKQGVDDFFAAGGTLEELGRYATATLKPPPGTRGDRPEIVVNGRFLEEISDECWKVIADLNGKYPTVFERGGRLVGVRHDDNGASFLRDWTEDDSPFVMERRARFVRVGPEEEGSIRTPARIPKDVVADLMAAWQKPVPHLRGLVHTPIFDAKGLLTVVPGYQADTHLYYSPVGQPVPPVPVSPTDEDVANAKALLIEECLVDFRFDSVASRAHVLAAMLTPLTREMVIGPTPLFLIDAPVQGSGKGLLAQTIGVVVTGEPPAVMTQPRDTDEERKRITALLREGSPVLLIDNIKQRLDSPVLAAALTSEVWSDRLLGSTESLRLPNRSLWLATGNNVELDGEIGRRTVPIRSDPKMDRPWERTGFRHNPLLRWVRDRRPDLVHAGLVLIQRWIAQGRPAWTGRAMGSFESWCEVVGGVLECAGIDGFLANRDDLYSRADSETEEWREFVRAWSERHGEEPVRAADLAHLVQELDLLPGMVATVRGEATEQAIRVRLGKALAKRRDRLIGEHFIRVLVRDSHSKGNVYALETAEGGDGSDQPSANPPQRNGPISGSVAEGAEDAEGDPDLHARDFSSFIGSSHTRLENLHTEGKRPPHPPHSDSFEPPKSAEGTAEGVVWPFNPPQGSNLGPRCRDCGGVLSVVAVSDRCGYCRAAERSQS